MIKGMLSITRRKILHIGMGNNINTHSYGVRVGEVKPLYPICDAYVLVTIRSRTCSFPWSNEHCRYICAGEVKSILPKCGVDVPVMISSCICSFSYSRSLYRKMNPKKHTFVFSHEHQDELMNIKKSNQMAKL